MNATQTEYSERTKAAARELARAMEAQTARINQTLGAMIAAAHAAQQADDPDAVYRSYTNLMTIAQGLRVDLGSVGNILSPAMMLAYEMGHDAAKEER